MRNQVSLKSFGDGSFPIFQCNVFVDGAFVIFSFTSFADGVLEYLEFNVIAGVPEASF